MAVLAPEVAFLPVARADRATLDRQRRLVASHGVIAPLCEGIPHPLVVLNAQRQIVLGNRALCEMLGVEDIDEITGQRTGEVLGCEIAARAPGGCGTAAGCRHCGGALATAAAQQGRHRQLACVVDREGECVPFELEASAHPLDLEGERFVLLVLTDVRDQRRRRVLERLFFHDVLNTAGGLVGLSEALAAYLPGNPPELAELSDLLIASGRQLLEEIRAQRDLAAAESGELAVAPAAVDLPGLLRGVRDTYRHHPVAAGRVVSVVHGEPLRIQTDPTLLGRVVGNLVKNALEAVPPGATVALSAFAEPGGAAVRVWNPGLVPAAARRHLFRRVFSTKGTGRGLGTYSVRLLTEQYLGGRVSWTSEAGEGTAVVLHLPERPAIAAEAADGAAAPAAS